MTITPIGGGVDVPAYVADTAGNKENAIVVVPVNADGTPAGGGGGSQANPSIVGGEYNSTLPTIANGGADSLQLGSRGSLNVQIYGQDNTTGVNTQTGADTSSNANGGLVTYARGVIFNGTSWDRMRGDTTGTFVKANPLTGTDRSATATTTSTQLMAANTTRSKFFIKNDTAIVVWINMGATAVATPGSGNISIAANGGYFEFTGYGGAVNIIAASTTAAVTAREF